MATAREEGAVAIITALVLVVLILLAAFLVDLGATRADARTDQLLADSAVMAGVSLDDDVVAQCKEAVDYFAANVSAGDVADSCDELASAIPCEDDTASVTTSPITVGAYTLTFTHPVDDANPSMTVQGQAVDDSRDGDRCDRLKVEVRRTRDYTFAPVGGAAGSGGSVNDAVARRKTDAGEPEYATLIVLEQQECPTLTSTGGGSVIVQNVYASDDADAEVEAQGIIHLDSDASQSCGGNSGNGRVVHPGASGNSAICAGVDGRHESDEPDPLVAIVEDADCGEVLDDTIRTKADTNIALSRFLDGGDDDEQLEADPLNFDERITRALVDHTYNCIEGEYPTDAEGRQYPDRGLVEANTPCEDAHRGPHIDQLIASTVDSGPGAPPGFDTYTDSWDCGAPPAGGVDVQYLYVDCDQLPHADFTTDVLVLEGGNHPNADGINVGTGEAATVAPYSTDPADDGAAAVVVREGHVRVAGGGQLELRDTFVYLHDGEMSVSGGENLTWYAPDKEGYGESGATGCQPIETIGAVTLPESLPDPSCFENLALWTNSDEVHSMAGNGSISVRGVFFGPNAEFSLSGSGNAEGAPLGLENAQFFTRTLDIAGGNGVGLQPDKDTFIETPPLGPALIR